ncbi:hypothetical protein E2C01_055056 [Portunus trituberculatus]|uniref:Uncharacterized protein n=1 Tax=Portunus trituberculatus TaxID=210409 RepID=A0A5B7GWL0_PORTR|nr:hypothetical protein [Portunus trituberculatus]
MCLNRNIAEMSTNQFRKHCMGGYSAPQAPNRYGGKGLRGAGLPGVGIVASRERKPLSQRMKHLLCVFVRAVLLSWRVEVVTSHRDPEPISDAWNFSLRLQFNFRFALTHLPGPRRGGDAASCPTGGD